MDWTTLDEKNNAEHYQVVAIRNQHKAQAMIPELLAIRDSILIIDNLPEPERLERQELRDDLKIDYYRKVKAINDLCAHDWKIILSGGFHLDAGEVWDDCKDEITCSNCGMNWMYLAAPSVPEPVTF